MEMSSSSAQLPVMPSISPKAVPSALISPASGPSVTVPARNAVSYELPIITVIFNNSVLGMVRQWQTSFYGKRYSQTDPHRKTDFVKLADGFGLKGYRCTNLPEFQEAFADALQQKGPTWIECIIDKDEKVLPMIPGGGDINDIIME